MTAFVDSYSFSHRFSGDTTSDTAGYQEIIHQCQEVNATGLTRQFFQFALGCGYAPQSVIEAFEMLADEYSSAYCYDKGSDREN
jgi:uroporphyrinogen-III decarboxylase